jgi:hypothetical protein
MRPATGAKTSELATSDQTQFDNISWGRGPNTATQLRDLYRRDDIARALFACGGGLDDGESTVAGSSTEWLPQRGDGTGRTRSSRSLDAQAHRPSTVRRRFYQWPPPATGRPWRTIRRLEQH